MAMPVGCVLSLAWNNPYTRDEAPLALTLWAVTIIDPGVERHEACAWMRQACPEQRPGDGYSPTWQPPVRPIRRLSAEAKGRIRRSRLRRRLQTKLPLLADQLYTQELGRRAGYFAGEDTAQTAEPAATAAGRR